PHASTGRDSKTRRPRSRRGGNLEGGPRVPAYGIASPKRPRRRTHGRPPIPFARRTPEVPRPDSKSPDGPSTRGRRPRLSRPRLREPSKFPKARQLADEAFQALAMMPMDRAHGIRREGYVQAREGDVESGLERAAPRTSGNRHSSSG